MGREKEYSVSLLNRKENMHFVYYLNNHQSYFAFGDRRDIFFYLKMDTDFYKCERSSVFSSYNNFKRTFFFFFCSGYPKLL